MPGLRNNKSNVVEGTNEKLRVKPVLSFNASWTEDYKREPSKRQYIKAMNLDSSKNFKMSYIGGTDELDG